MKSNLVKLGIKIILGVLIVPTTIFASSIINVDSISYRLTDGQEKIDLKANPGETINQEIEISNNSEQKITLSLKADDAEGEGENFKIKDNSSDIKNWLKLSKSEITIPSHQSIKVGATIKVPLSAGVGEHYGAILGKYELANSDSEKINLENGLRIKLTVSGEAHNDFKLLNPTVDENGDRLSYSGRIFNSGNTTLNGQITLNKNVQKVSIQPNDTADFSFEIPKGNKYVSTVKLNDISKAYLLNPANEKTGLNLLIILGLIGIGIIALNRTKKLSPEKAGFILLCLISIGFVSEINKNSELRADVISQNTKTYLTTIKFGNLPERQISKDDKVQWNGTLQLNQGKMIIVQKLHNEPSDQIYLNQEGNTLYFNNFTGPDNDGIILLIKAEDSINKPQLRYHNSLSGKDQIVDLEKTLNQPTLINYKNFGVEISSEIPGSTITAYINNKAYNLKTNEYISESITEITSTQEIESVSEEAATPEVESITIPSDQLKNELNLLQEIISEIPASSEILTDYILNSDHVEEVTYDSNVTTVKADEDLINTLKETPLTIDELTSSPEINFVFTPNEKINLTPQQFSFNEVRTSSQLLGEIVLVQNRQSDWATSISISDFESLSGNNSISASNTVIIPGKIKIISQKGEAAEITAGPEHRFTGSNDQATLVNIVPNNNEKTIFSIQPTLSVRIPAGTPPGRYKANITIRVL